jgi:hypothetical protein
MTKELPEGTGILLAIATAPVDVTPILLSRISRVRLTELPVLFANVPPIIILFVDAGEVYAVVGPRNLTV